MDAEALKTVEIFWQEYMKVHPLVTAIMLLVVSQLVVTFFQELKSRSERKYQENRQRWNDLRNAYQECLHELSIARRVPIRRESPPEEKGLWHLPADFNGAMAGLMPLIALLTLLETYSYSCKGEIQDSRNKLREVVDEARGKPHKTIRKGPGSKENTVMQVRADCGLAKTVDHLIQVISECAQKDLEWAPKRYWFLNTFARLRSRLRDLFPG
jgi:hypothetical protein